MRSIISRPQRKNQVSCDSQKFPRFILTPPTANLNPIISLTFPGDSPHANFIFFTITFHSFNLSHHATLPSRLATFHPWVE